MEYTGYKTIEFSDKQLADFYEDKNNSFNLLENEYLLIKDSEKQLVDKYVLQDNQLRRVKYTKFDNEFTGSIKPRNPEQEILFDMLADSKSTLKLVTGGFGCGKAQPINSIIPTPDGYKRLGDIKIGDYVFDRMGQPTQVLGIFPQGIIDNYKIYFNDDRVAYCNNEHIWSCLTSRGNLKQVTVKQMLEEGLQTSSGKYKYSIPTTEPVNYTTKFFRLDPYVLGVLLGDGCCLENNLTISSKDKEIIDEVARLINADEVIKYTLNNYSWNFKKDGKLIKTKDIVDNLKGVCEYSYNKSIPQKYLLGSIEQRLSLLQGLLDTDGTIDDKGRINFTTTSEDLLEDVKELCYSLGFKTNTYIDRREKYTNGICYSLSISSRAKDKQKLFRLFRKKEKALSLEETKYSRQNNLTIRKVEKIGQEEMVCIYVDNKEHLYLTSNYIVTHNTMSLVVAALDAIHKGKFDKIVWVRNNIDVKDTVPLGALPGDSFDKLLPFVMPLADHAGGIEGIRMLMDKNQLEIVHLGYLRGRDIRNSIILCSEAENLTKQHIQLLIGRVGEGSNLWMDADLKQRDKIVFEKSAGLETMIERLKGNELFGYVKLLKTERSKTAQLADLLDD